jgi:HEAT repeat protein
MTPTNQFPFRSRGYYLRYAIADRLLPRSLFLRFFGDAEVLPRPLPGTPQAWLDAIAGSDPTAWKDATLILGGLEESDRVDPAPFLASLKSDGEDVVFWSLIALQRIGAPAKAGLDQIATVLRHPAFGVRQTAIGALADLAIDEARVQDMIVASLDDANAFVRAEAVRALEQASTLREFAIAKLRLLLADPDEDVRDYAKRCLERHNHDGS